MDSCDNLWSIPFFSPQISPFYKNLAFGSPQLYTWKSVLLSACCSSTGSFHLPPFYSRAHYLTKVSNKAPSDGLDYTTTCTNTGPLAPVSSTGFLKPFITCPILTGSVLANRSSLTKLPNNPVNCTYQYLTFAHGAPTGKTLSSLLIIFKFYPTFFMINWNTQQSAHCSLNPYLFHFYYLILHSIL